jgi:RNA polymerase sigma-70 factor (ECF subfamily)
VSATRHLAALLVAAVPDGAPTPGPDLEAWIERLLADAHAAHPTLALDDDLFIERVARVWPTGEAGLPDLRAAELYLTAAAAAGDQAAVELIDTRDFVDARNAVERMNLGQARADDALQTFRRKLFVSDGADAPKIVEYGGRGDLRGWLRVGAVREALKIVRSEKREVAMDDARLLDDAPGAARDPELEQMKALYQPAFKRCFAEALASLPAREKNLLRQQVLDGLSIDDLAALYKVHRATCARWLESARRQLFDETRRRLVEDVGIAENECDSIIRLVQSQLHLTLRRVLDP